MGIVIFCATAENEYNNSRAVIASLVKLQLKQNTTYNVNREEIQNLKKNIKLDKLRQIHKYTSTKSKYNTMFFVS